MGETRKTKERWIRNGEYQKFIEGKNGIDIGVGRIDAHEGPDTINPDFYQHDKDDCDAVTMDIFEDNFFDVVWASHVLEHLNDPILAIKNWIRICKPGGIVAIFVPDAELYEGVPRLPSMWNEDHKTMWLAFDFSPPNTFSLEDTVLRAIGQNDASIYSIIRCDEGWYKPNKETHAIGEYQIECIIKKWGN